jgi:hypothetical protein
MFTDYLSEYIDNLNLKNKSLFVAGDFNINLLKHKTCTHVDHFIDSMTAQGLTPSIVLPTRISHSTSTLIDNIFVNCLSHSHYSKVIFEDISDHLPIYVILNLKKNSLQSSTSQDIAKRIFSETNYLIFKNLVSNIDWQPILPDHPLLDSLSPSQSYDIFFHKFHKAFDTAFPLIKRCLQPTRWNRSPPWFSHAHLLACRKKSRLQKKYSKHKTFENKTKLVQFRSMLKASLRKAERNYYSHEFQLRNHNAKATWSLLNDRMNRKTSHESSRSIPSLLVNNIKYDSPTDIANQLNIYFSSVGSILASNCPPPNLPFNYYLPPSVPNSLAFLPTDQYEILNIIYSFDNSASCGPDEIPSSAVKSIAQFISLPLSLLINNSFNKGTFPDQLKLAKVIPIYKSGSKSDPNNYRPISLLNFFSKVFEKVIYSRLLQFINDSNILYPNQFGFRKNFSTDHALV